MRAVSIVLAAVVLITAAVLSGGCEHGIIPDSALESKIRVLISKPEGELTAADLESIASIWAPELKIKNLTGLEYCVNLSDLNVSNNKIKDISPLANLNKLRVLNLENNKIKDISALTGKKYLTNLNLGNNLITDITPLHNMTDMVHLTLKNNPIADIKALGNMTELDYLSINDTEIEDITTLSGMTNLRFVHAERNSIQDASPLLSLHNLKTVLIDCNPLSEISVNTIVPGLREQGIFVRCWPTNEDIDTHAQARGSFIFQASLVLNPGVPDTLHTSVFSPFLSLLSIQNIPATILHSHANILNSST